MSGARVDGSADLVPYDGCCSKGALWGVATFVLPPLALVAALVTGHSVPASVGGSLAFFLFMGAVVFFCGANEFQIWALQHPGNLLSRIGLSWMIPIQGLVGSNWWLQWQQTRLGNNFCYAGKLLLGETAEVKRALLEPQARKYHLGQTVFIKEHCPGDDLGQRTTFLLAMSDEGAGGDGTHAKFRACAFQYLLGQGMVARRADAVGRGMIDQLARDYAADQAAFFSSNGPLETFVIKYLNYVMLGLELEGDDLKDVTSFLGGRVGLLHYIWPTGFAVNKRSLIDRVAAIYERAPALSGFEEGVAAHGNMTRAELARAMTATLRIAGKTGTLRLLGCLLGGVKLETDRFIGAGASIDVTKAWDQLDLDDRDELELFALEVARLDPPVNCAHRVATEPLTCEITGRKVSFPAGTLVLVPVQFAGLDRDIWGDSVYQLDHRRANLRETYVGFNSVGDEGRRLCPGRGVVLELCVDLLAALGRVRRGGGAAGAAAPPAEQAPLLP